MIEQTNKSLFGYDFSKLANLNTTSRDNNLFDDKQKNLDNKNIELESVKIDTVNSISGSLVTNKKESLNIKSNLSDFSTQSFAENFLLDSLVDNTYNLDIRLNKFENQSINNFKVQLNQAVNVSTPKSNSILQGQNNKEFILKSTAVLNNQNNVDTTLTRSINSALRSTTNVFRGDLNFDSKIEQLKRSNSVGFNNYLTNLNARLDTTNNDESFVDFTKKIFSKDTLTEIGELSKTAAIDLGKDLLKSLIPKISFNKKEDNLRKLPRRFFYEEDLLTKDILNIIGTLETVNVYPFQYMENPEWEFEKTGISKDSLNINYDLDYKASISKENNKKDVSKPFIEYTKKYIIGSANGLADRLELAIIEKLGISTKHTFVNIDYGETSKKYPIKGFTRQDQSKLFENWITKNPLLGQHQYNLSIKSLSNQKIKNNYSDIATTTDIEKDLTFRVQGINIPDIKRNVSNSIYGYSTISTLNNLQAETENKAELEIICDKNLNTLEYLILLTGLGICENINEKDNQKIYNLSTISDSNFNEENYNYAILSIYNGRDIAKALYMENPEWEFEKTGISKDSLNINYDLDYKASISKENNKKDVSKPSEKVIYAMLPQFTFEDFKIVNIDYSFDFETNTSAKLLKLKTTCTWSKMYIDWVSPEKRFYDTTTKNILSKS